MPVTDLISPVQKGGGKGITATLITSGHLSRMTNMPLEGHFTGGGVVEAHSRTSNKCCPNKMLGQ